MTVIRENGATSGVGVLATYAYDNLGRRSSLTRGNGTATSYTYDPVSRLATLSEDMASTPNDQSTTFSYNPASQIASLTKTNDAYAWTGHGNGSTASVANGLNQLTTIGGTATTHDSKGNVTFDPMSGKTYAYSSENLLTSSSGGTSATLAYDPAMRLYQVAAGATTHFAYDGLNLIAEYDGSNALQHRYVFGPAVDEPLVQYDGSGTANRGWMHSDERGSIIAISDGSGVVTTIDKYDEYGKPQSANAGRFQYTGQLWLPEIGAYYYKARFYSPVFGGRFLQTDPIDVAGGISLYAYVGNDPVNGTDPTGLRKRMCTGSISPQSSCGEANPGSRLYSNGVDVQAAEMELDRFIAENNWNIGDHGPSITPTRDFILKYGWYENVNGEKVHFDWSGGFELAGVSPNFYHGEPHSAFHWYADQLEIGGEQARQQAKEIKDQCLSGENKVDLGQVAADAGITVTVTEIDPAVRC